MKHYYFSGIDRASFLCLLAREGGAGMVNALNATQPSMLAAYARFPEVPLVLDSGAFQGNTDIDGYINIVLQVKGRFDWVANLDVIGNQEKSDANWSRICEAGIQPLWVYQVNGGKDLGYLRKNAHALKFIGLGGLVPVIKDSVAAARELIGNIGEVLHAVGARAHVFGVGSPSILSEFCDTDWFESADSQSWLCGFKALEMIRRDGTRLKSDSFGLSLTGEECAAQNIRQIHGFMQGQPLQLSML